MGYTHYWYRPVGSEIEPRVWHGICEETRRLIEFSNLAVAFDYDLTDEPPLIDSLAIRFNGKADFGHETFMVERVCPPQVEWRKDKPDVFTFCKTERKPYDDLVCAVLALIAERVPTFSVSSDGTKQEWQPALHWAGAILGRRIANPVGNQDSKETP